MRSFRQNRRHYLQLQTVKTKRYSNKMRFFPIPDATVKDEADVSCESKYSYSPAPLSFHELLAQLASLPEFNEVTDVDIEETLWEIENKIAIPDEVLELTSRRLSREEDEKCDKDQQEFVDHSENDSGLGHLSDQMDWDDLMDGDDQKVDLTDEVKVMEQEDHGANTEEKESDEGFVEHGDRGVKVITDDLLADTYMNLAHIYHHYEYEDSEDNIAGRYPDSPEIEYALCWLAYQALS